MNLPVRWRLAFSFAVLSGILFALLGGVLFALADAGFRHESKKETRQAAATILSVFDEFPWARAVVELEEESREFGVIIRLLDPMGRPEFLTTGWAPWEWPVEGPPATGWSVRWFRGTPHDIYTQTVTKPGGEHHFLQVARSSSDRMVMRRILVVAINVGTALALVLSVGAGYFFAARALKPIDAIRRAADALNASTLGVALPLPAPRDELFALTATLNDLFKRIHENVGRLTQFTADVSHELRAPLTALKGTLEIALRRDRSAGEYRAAIQDAQEACERLVRLVDDLLFLAKADADRLSVRLEAVSLPDYLSNVLRKAAGWAMGKNGVLRLDPVPPERVSLDPDQTQRLLWNIMDNALKHSPPGGDVHVGARREDKSMVIYVRDAGSGVPPEDREKIFDRFYRRDVSRSRDTGGAGLGLAIARSIAEAQGGALVYRALPEGGSEFLFRMRAF